MDPLLGPIGAGLAALVSAAGSAVAAAAAGGAASSSAALTMSLGVVVVILLEEKNDTLVEFLEETLGVATKKLDAAEAMLQLAICFNFLTFCF